MHKEGASSTEAGSTQTVPAQRLGTMQGEQALPRGWVQLLTRCRLAGARLFVREDTREGRPLAVSMQAVQVAAQGAARL